LFKLFAFTLAIAPLAPAQQGPATSPGAIHKAQSALPTTVLSPRQRPDPTRFASSLVEEAEPDIEVAELSPAAFTALTANTSGPSVISGQQAGGITLGSTPTQRMYEVTIHPGAGYTEKFVVAPASPGTARPLLVGFHKYGVSHYDVPLHTSFFRECMTRNWHAVAPLSATTTNFSSIPSQTNTEAVLNWMRNHFMVDSQRVYGVGFSMGGGDVMNYAARHLDPAKLMFAAVCNHTGTVALEDAYFNEPATQSIFDMWFGTGAPGSAVPWNLQRSSVLSMDPITLQINPGACLARNLMHLTTLTYHASNDPTAYLMTENDLLHNYFVGLGAQPGQHDEIVLPGTVHTWDLIDEKAICNWFKTKRLTIPTSGDTLADRDGNYFYFNVEQDAPGSFTPFVWNVDKLANSFTLSATSNLKKISIDSVATELHNDLPMLVSMSTTDGLADDVRLRTWGHLPFNVLRDGVATTSWTYDAPSGDLTLLETDGATTHVWQVVP
jgi:hypothetical protein